jgi:hypothetical protein
MNCFPRFPKLRVLNGGGVGSGGGGDGKEVDLLLYLLLTEHYPVYELPFYG